MGVELIINDCDGTLTDIDKESPTFIKEFKKDIQKYLGWIDNFFNKEWDAAEKLVTENPMDYGWFQGVGIIVVNSDPIIKAQTIACKLFDDRKLLLDDNERFQFLYPLFKSNYEKMPTIFKPEAKEYLWNAKLDYNTCIITNSHPDSVKKKFEYMPQHSDIKIYGDAKKFIMDRKWDGVPETIEKDGFPRPVNLRAKFYWDVLNNIMDEKKIRAEQVVVVGDIYEFDLALPEYMGMNIILLPTKNTYDFEMSVVNKSEKGYVANNLYDANNHIDEINNSL
ncbi:MAG: HAD family hydrolase [archaeon]